MNSQEWPEIKVTVRKQQATITVSNRLLADVDPVFAAAHPEPRDPRFERWGVFWWAHRRQDVADALVKPLWWLGRAGDGANWLGVEVTNLLYRLFRVNARMVHDSPEDDEDD